MTKPASESVIADLMAEHAAQVAAIVTHYDFGTTVFR